LTLPASPGTQRGMTEAPDPDLDPGGSPYHALLGLTLLDWRDGFARVACEAGPQHRTAPASPMAGCCCR
jgi:hypothetical protein